MAVRRKNFSTTKPQGSDDVVVLDMNQGTPQQQSFPCVGRIPGIVLVEFISELDEENPASAGAAVVSLLKAALRPDAFEPFMAYCRNPDNGIELEELVEICSWLAEQYTGENPTQSSPGSSAGSPTSGLGPLGQPLGLAETPVDFPLMSSST